MTSMRAPNGGNIASVARSGEPIVYGRANAAPLDRRLAWTMVTGDQKHNSVAARDCVIEATIDGVPGSVEVHAMEIDNAVRSDSAGAELLVPARVERFLANWNRPSGCDHRPRDGFYRSRRRHNFFRFYRDFRTGFLMGQRPDRGGDARPQLRFLRAERAHERQRPWAPGSALRLKPTCRLRLRPPLGQSPRRCRNGSGP